MNADLIVDFPHQRKNRAAHFAKTAQLRIFNRPNVARHELSYTRSEYDLMKLVVGEDVLAVRAGRTSREPGDESKESALCFMGIEHLLTPACIDEVRACRARCIRAVLTEQARARSASATGFVDWETIAFASLAQTRKAILRARKLGKLHENLSDCACGRLPKCD
mmetsp:Transcript_36650/g.74818  ORF Transcript_36650/g.74818 Transcript_36650/m.74818 type:complete len:165 (-) Transcript_36650:9-503(-)